MKTKQIALLALAASLMSGCASLGNPYAGMKPLDVTAASVKKHAPNVTPNSGGPSLAMFSAFIPDEQAKQAVISDLKTYCQKSNGQVIPFQSTPGFACYIPAAKSETFALSDAAELRVLEKRPGDKSFDILTETFGYMSPERQRQLAQETQRRVDEGRKRAEEARLAQRKAESYKVKVAGTRVCQDAQAMGIGKVVLVGTVEQVAGDRVKVFVESAQIPGAPGLSPGGFEQHYSWVNAWDVYQCGS